MATPSISENSSEVNNQSVVNPTLRALEIVHRLNRYDPVAVREALEAVEAKYPSRETGAQRTSRLARVLAESFNHVFDTGSEVE